MNYKIRQTNEEWKVFNDRIIRMHVDYDIILYVPSWFNLDLLDSELDCFDNLEYKGQNISDEDNYQTRIITYGFRTSSLAKCDESRDEFSEETGIYICETRAEIKVLEKVQKIINAIYKVISREIEFKENTNNLITERLEKNKWNLERLKGSLSEGD